MRKQKQNHLNGSREKELPRKKGKRKELQREKKGELKKKSEVERDNESIKRVER